VVVGVAAVGVAGGVGAVDGVVVGVAAGVADIGVGAVVRSGVVVVDVIGVERRCGLSWGVES